MQLDILPVAVPGERWAGHLSVLQATVARHAQAASPEAALQARRLLLDTLGCAIAGRHAPEVMRLETILARLEPGAWRFPGGPPLTMASATQVLATAATWDEACEGHALAHGRPGVALIAALLPLALQGGASLRHFVDAFVLGYEVGARAGAWLRVRPGMHVDANWPSIGVAAGVAGLLGLPPAGILQAINIAACQLATSLYLPVATGCTARNTYLAHSALLGSQAAFASAAGMDAPPDALAHYANDHAAASAQDMPPATKTLLLSAYIKPFAAVRHVHYGAVAAARIRERLAGATQGIEALTLTVYPEAAVYCGNRAPRTPIQAQFSLSFGVAAMLRFGELDPSVYAADRFDDAELRRLEALVVVHTDEALFQSSGPSGPSGRGATLDVEHTGGPLHEQVGVIAGDPGQALDRGALCAKFRRYTARDLLDKRALLFCNTLLDVPDIDLAALWQRIAPVKPASSRRGNASTADIDSATHLIPGLK